MQRLPVIGFSLSKLLFTDFVSLIEVFKSLHVLMPAQMASLRISLPVEYPAPCRVYPKDQLEVSCCSPTTLLPLCHILLQFLLQATGILMMCSCCCMTVCVSEFPCKYSFQERALVAFKPRPILFIMNKICLNQQEFVIMENQRSYLVPPAWWLSVAPGICFSIVGCKNPVRLSSHIQLVVHGCHTSSHAPVHWNWCKLFLSILLCLELEKL